MSRLKLITDMALIKVLPVKLARACVQRHMPPLHRLTHGNRQLLVDVSVIVQDDKRTGIQRVVRALLHQLTETPPPGFDIRPVFATREHSYRYAAPCRFQFGSPPMEGDGDIPVHVEPGDVFLGLDLSAHLLPAYHTDLFRWKQKGATVHIMVYDLLPVLHPNWFRSKTSRNIHRWLRAVAVYADSVICISKVVKGDVENWLDSRYGMGPGEFPIHTISLGADISASLPSKGLREDVDSLLGMLRSNPSVLMVGTLEPRKGHAQVLGAFESLWCQGRNVNLVLVGRPGWRTEKLQQALRAHGQTNRHLFWFENASDEFLELLYNTCTGVIVASEAEGFGLPLVEALGYNKPVLARDIPIFREIAESRLVTFFRGNDARSLGPSIVQWLNVIAKVRRFENDRDLITWRESADELVMCLTGSENDPFDLATA